MPVPQLSPAKRAELRADAHALKPVVMVGAEGLTEAVIAETDQALSAHGLIKIRVFGDDREHRLDVYRSLCERLDAAPIQHIGKLLVLWRALPIKEAPRAASPAAKSGARGARGARGKAGAPSGAVVKAGALGRAGRTLAPRAASDSARGAAPRIVHIVKPTSNPTRRPRAKATLVLGNERVTAGGLVKRVKSRNATSTKRNRQNDK